MILKLEPQRVWITISVNRMKYCDNDSSPAWNLLWANTILNRKILDTKKGSRFITADTKDHFLATLTRHTEFVKVPCKCTPDNIYKYCNLDKKITQNEYIWIKIQKKYHR